MAITITRSLTGTRMTGVMYIYIMHWLLAHC